MNNKEKPEILIPKGYSVIWTGIYGMKSPSGWRR